jgi:hypothetical protein
MPILTKQRPDIELFIYGSKIPKEFKDYETDSIKIVGLNSAKQTLLTVDKLLNSF